MLETVFSHAHWQTVLLELFAIVSIVIFSILLQIPLIQSTRVGLIGCPHTKPSHALKEKNFSYRETYKS